MILEGCGVMACMLIMLAAPRKRCQPSPISSGPPAVASCEPITADLRFRDSQDPPDEFGSVTVIWEGTGDDCGSGEPVTGAILKTYDGVITAILEPESATVSSWIDSVTPALETAVSG